MDKGTWTLFHHGGGIADSTATCNSFLGVELVLFLPMAFSGILPLKDSSFYFVFRRLKTFYEFILINTRQWKDNSIIVSHKKLNNMKNGMIIKVVQQG